jgi:uncharacterized membrane protein YtjA (UPF0391 family)
MWCIVAGGNRPDAPALDQPVLRIRALVRWLTVLCILTVLTGAVALGAVKTDDTGLARILFEAYTGLLGVTVIVALLRGY